MRPLQILPPLVFLLLGAALPSQAADACFTIHGRAHLYGGDGQLRIWHIGTHHEFEPDESTWAKVESWLEAGVKESDRNRYASPASMLNLFADFLICPTEPFKAGSVQKAKILSATHRHYVPVP
ncbi:MAG TPA: hypothetical protein VHA14_09950 [Bryobacteraceae bacterium]|nr:hypothetical protein [Bryobacteraceae bacterium]